jgi:hypothetical protein
MDTRERFERQIVSSSSIENYNGYVRDYRDNVLLSIKTDEYEADLMAGAGSELKSKFSAIYSSSALVVNTFAPFKRFKQNIILLGYNNFISARFEREFKTGLSGTPPTLDFCLENENVVIAIESKYLETLRKKEAKFVDSYFDNKVVGEEYNNLILKYNNKKGYLDFAQLIKHSMGLGRYAKKFNKKVILLYLYWIPKNWSKFEEYKEHNTEIEQFRNEICKIKDIEFFDMNYIEFWRKYSNDENVGEFIQETKKRYDKEID